MKYCYLENEKNFTEDNLKKNRSRVIQLKWSDGSPDKTRQAILVEYDILITILFHSITFKDASYSERKEKLRQWLDELRRKYPSEYLRRELGWYDLAMQKEKEEKLRWLAMPVDKYLLAKARKEGRVVVIVRR